MTPATRGKLHSPHVFFPNGECFASSHRIHALVRLRPGPLQHNAAKTLPAKAASTPHPFENRAAAYQRYRRSTAVVDQLFDPSRCLR